MAILILAVQYSHGFSVKCKFLCEKWQIASLRESSLNITRGGMKILILRGAPKIFRHPKGGL